MRKQIYILLLFVVSFGIYANAKEIKVKSFSLQMEPMTVPMQRRDQNNQVCGLVKIACSVDGASFKGNVIGMERSGSEYWVYVSPGTKYLQIHVPDFMPYMLNFNDWNINRILSKSIYYVNIEVVKHDQPQTNPTLSECVSLYNKKEYGKAKNLALTSIDEMSLDSNVAARLSAIAKQCDSIVANISRLNWYAKTLNSLNATPIIENPECFMYYNNAGDKKGICDVEGHSLISPIFSRIIPTDKNRFLALSNDKWIIVDTNGRTIKDCLGINECWPSSIEKEYGIERGIVVSNSNKLYGLMDRRTGEIIIPVSYNHLTKADVVYLGYNNGDSRVFIHELENGTSKRVSLPGYFVSYLGYGKIKIAKKRKKIEEDWYAFEQYGICNLDGKIILPMKYEGIESGNCESVALEEHIKTKYGWVREGHLYNFKHDIMLVEGLVGEFRYTNPPIFFEKGWACHRYTNDRIYNPNTGEQLPVQNDDLFKTIENLGQFNDDKNEKLQLREVVNSNGIEFERICNLGDTPIKIIRRASDRRLGFEDSEGNLMFGEL